MRSIVLTLWAARRTLIPLILATIAVMVAFQSLLGFIQHLFNYGDVFIYDRVRISGTLGNYLASYLLLGFIVTLTYSTQRSNPRWFWFLLSGLILIALVLVQVRTIWILAAFALALVFLFSVTSMKNTAGILSVLIISVVLFFAVAGVMRTSGTSNIFSTLERRSNTTGVLRLELWSSAVKMFRDHPLVGVGLGFYESLSSRPL